MSVCHERRRRAKFELTSRRSMADVLGEDVCVRMRSEKWTERTVSRCASDPCSCHFQGLEHEKIALTHKASVKEEAGSPQCRNNHSETYVSILIPRSNVGTWRVDLEIIPISSSSLHSALTAPVSPFPCHT